MHGHEDTETDDVNPADEALAAEVEQAQAGADPETVARMVRAFDIWEAAKEFKKKEGKRLSDQLAARISLFAEAMNVGHSTVNDQVLKLSVVETRWQDLEDAREEKKQIATACRDAVKAAEQRIRDALADAKSGQMSLFNPPGREDESAA